MDDAKEAGIVVDDFSADAAHDEASSEDEQDLTEEQCLHCKMLKTCLW